MPVAIAPIVLEQKKREGASKDAALAPVRMSVKVALEGFMEILRNFSHETDGSGWARHLLVPPHSLLVVQRLADLAHRSASGVGHPDLRGLQGLVLT